MSIKNITLFLARNAARGFIIYTVGKKGKDIVHIACEGIKKIPHGTITTCLKLAHERTVFLKPLGRDVYDFSKACWTITKKGNSFLCNNCADIKKTEEEIAKFVTSIQDKFKHFTKKDNALPAGDTNSEGEGIGTTEDSDSEGETSLLLPPPERSSSSSTSFTPHNPKPYTFPGFEFPSQPPPTTTTTCLSTSTRTPTPQKIDEQHPNLKGALIGGCIGVSIGLIFPGGKIGLIGGALQGAIMGSKRDSEQKECDGESRYSSSSLSSASPFPSPPPSLLPPQSTTTTSSPFSVHQKTSQKSWRQFWK